MNRDPNEVWDPLKPLDRLLALERRVITGIKLPPFLKEPSASVKNHYEAISRLSLPLSVPVDVRQSWDVARNLYLYSMFYFRFQDVARLQGSAAIEYALREALKPAPDKNGRVPGLKALLRTAIDAGRIRIEQFGWWRRSKFASKRAEPKYGSGVGHEATADVVEESPRPSVRYLIEAIPMLRNEFAHGTYSLLGTSIDWMEIFRDLIGQLFEPPSDSNPIV